MFGKSVEKRIMRDVDKIIAMKEDVDSLSWGRVLSIAKRLQKDELPEEEVDYLARELTAIAQANIVLNSRLGVVEATATDRLIASGMEVLQGGYSEEALLKMDKAARENAEKDGAAQETEKPSEAAHDGDGASSNASLQADDGGAVRVSDAEASGEGERAEGEADSGGVAVEGDAGSDEVEAGAGERGADESGTGESEAGKAGDDGEVGVESDEGEPVSSEALAGSSAAEGAQDEASEDAAAKGSDGADASSNGDPVCSGKRSSDGEGDASGSGAEPAERNSDKKAVAASPDLSDAVASDEADHADTEASLSEANVDGAPASNSSDPSPSDSGLVVEAGKATLGAVVSESGSVPGAEPVTLSSSNHEKPKPESDVEPGDASSGSASGVTSDSELGTKLNEKLDGVPGGKLPGDPHELSHEDSTDTQGDLAKDEETQGVSPAKDGEASAKDRRAAKAAEKAARKRKRTARHGKHNPEAVLFGDTDDPTFEITGKHGAKRPKHAADDLPVKPRRLGRHAEVSDNDEDSFDGKRDDAKGDASPVDDGASISEGKEGKAGKKGKRKMRKGDVADGPDQEGTDSKRGREKGKKRRKGLFSRFTHVYESKDGGLCVFEDDEGHLVSVDSSKLA